MMFDIIIYLLIGVGDNIVSRCGLLEVYTYKKLDVFWVT